MIEEDRKSMLLRSRRSRGERHIRSGRNFESHYFSSCDDLSRARTTMSEGRTKSRRSRSSGPRSKLESQLRRLPRLDSHEKNGKVRDRSPSRRSTDEAEAEPPSTPRHHSKKFKVRDDNHLENVYQGLQTQLTALQLHAKVLEKELGQQRSSLEEERDKAERKQATMQRDLTESRETCVHLKHENTYLRKRLVTSETENAQLRVQLRILERDEEPQLIDGDSESDAQTFYYDYADHVPSKIILQRERQNFGPLDSRRRTMMRNPTGGFVPAA